jgi:hypothetical protein
MAAKKRKPTPKAKPRKRSRERVQRVTVNFGGVAKAIRATASAGAKAAGTVVDAGKTLIDHADKQYPPGQ